MFNGKHGGESQYYEVKSHSHHVKFLYVGECGDHLLKCIFKFSNGLIRYPSTYIGRQGENCHELTETL